MTGVSSLLTFFLGGYFTLTYHQSNIPKFVAFIMGAIGIGSWVSLFTPVGKLRDEANHIVHVYRMIEWTFESLPQLLLQTYIITVIRYQSDDYEITLAQWESIVVNTVCAALTCASSDMAQKKDWTSKAKLWLWVRCNAVLHYHAAQIQYIAQHHACVSVAAQLHNVIISYVQQWASISTRSYTSLGADLHDLSAV